jgi:phosphoglycolate phosphatase-like HAD superfamily hydrolase
MVVIMHMEGYRKKKCLKLQMPKMPEIREMDPQNTLRNLKPTKEFFIGIDSDGCVFDTMEIKHKECFCPNFIKFFEMQKVSKYAREAWEFVNLYSKSRGTNRFPALIETIHLLGDRKEVKMRNANMPDMSPLMEWIRKETRLGNPALELYAGAARDAIIDLTLRWSKKVNSDIAEMVHDVPPFPFVRESLEKLAKRADSIIVSQTPVEALIREWKENKIDSLVNFIAGQEHGTKTEHIALAAKGKYPDNRILMVGDAPGDFQAAKKNGVLFFPVNPGHEEYSWERFLAEALGKFFNGTYTGAYESELIREFDVYLPENPPWKK